VGVGVVVFNDNGCVLMGLRKGAHAPGTWSFPGGWVDYEDESLEAAGLRELGEETDLTGEFDLNLFAVSTEKFPEQTPPFRTITVYLKANCVIDGAPMVKVMEPDKCVVWAWLDPRAKDFGPVFAGIPQMWKKVIEESEEIRSR
jgi:8-oxo-dGTP diphosphatase